MSWPERTPGSASSAIRMPMSKFWPILCCSDLMHATQIALHAAWQT